MAVDLEGGCARGCGSSLAIVPFLVYFFYGRNVNNAPPFTLLTLSVDFPPLLYSKYLAGPGSSTELLSLTLQVLTDNQIDTAN